MTRTRTNPLTGHRFPDISKFTRPLDAWMVNTLFGFPNGKKVPASFSGCRIFNGQMITCLVSQPNRKHRMMTDCPYCGKTLTVGCFPQHLRTMHTI